MPLISNNNVIDLENISQILKDENLTEFSQVPQKRQRRDENLNDIKNILNCNNGSVEDASSVITEVMHQSKYDNTRLKAAEIVLDLHEIRNKEGKLNKQPIINFNIISPDVQIANIFAPHSFRAGSKSSSECDSGEEF